MGNIFSEAPQQTVGSKRRRESRENESSRKRRRTIANKYQQQQEDQIQQETQQTPPTSNFVLAFSGFHKQQHHGCQLYLRESKFRLATLLSQSPFRATSLRIGRHPQQQQQQIPNSQIPESHSQQQQMLHSHLLLHPSVTHVIAPPEARTVAVLVAALTGVWVLPPEWGMECVKRGRWVPESQFGFKRSENPIQQRKVFLSNHFMETHGSVIVNQCKQVLLLGKAELVSAPHDADICLVAPSDPLSNSDEKGNYIVFTWQQFMDEILYPKVLASALKRAVGEWME